MIKNHNEARTFQLYNLVVQGIPEKTPISEKGSYLTKGHFFWDTLYDPVLNNPVTRDQRQGLWLVTYDRSAIPIGTKTFLSHGVDLSQIIYWLLIPTYRFFLVYLCKELNVYFIRLPIKLLNGLSTEDTDCYYLTFFIGDIQFSFQTLELSSTLNSQI